jgi:outer membrane protein TolC
VAETEAAQARRKELIADYRASIIGAFSDVMTSLGAIESLAAQETASQAARDAARRASSLSEVRYKAGVDTLLTLLNAQQTLYQSEDDLAQTRFARLQALVGLYRALGGGWQNPEAMQTAAVNSHNG